MPRVPGHRGRRAAAAVVVVGLAVTMVATWWVGTAEREAADERLTGRADRAVFVLRTQVDRYVAAGAAVSAALSRDPLMGPQAYGRLLETVSADQDLAGLGGLNAIRLVDPATVEGFARRQQEVQPGFELRLAEDVDRHAVLFRVYPPARNAPALGFDVFANPPAAVALRRSLRANTARMTDAISLQQSPDRQDGLVVYTPTRVDGEIVGWVSVAMHGQALMDAVSDGLGIRMTVVDQTPDDAVTIARAHGGVGDATPRQQLRTMLLYGQTWRVSVAPLGDGASPVSWLVAGSGLVVTVVLAALVLTVGRSERRAIELADARTDELAEANRELQGANVELERAGRAKDDLVSAVSHELRTPLTIIRGFASTLVRGSVEMPPEARDALDLIDLHARRLDRIVSDMLLTARLANGDEIPTPSAVPVVAHVRTVADRLAESEDVHIGVSGPTGLMARADVGHVSTILDQLFSNAAKYGAPPVDVEVEAVAGQVEIRVSDGGRGLSPELASSLFDQFAQADAGDRRRSQGVGLGLWIVQHLAELNGGSADYCADERPTFVVRLPAASSIASSTVATEHPRVG